MPVTRVNNPSPPSPEVRSPCQTSCRPRPESASSPAGGSSPCRCWPPACQSSWVVTLATAPRAACSVQRAACSVQRAACAANLPGVHTIISAPLFSSAICSDIPVPPAEAELHYFSPLRKYAWHFTGQIFFGGTLSCFTSLCHGNNTAFYQSITIDTNGPSSVD